MTQPLKYILESLLFVAEEPLSVQQFSAIVETGEADAIRAALEELIEEYDHRGGGFELRRIAGGYQFRTRSEYSEWVKKLLKPSPARLSRASLETLAIIAYKQPIIRADVEHIRGVDCGGVLRMLLEKKLIRVMGRKDIPGRPMIYGTTRQFLEVFNLKDLRDLPSPKEIEALGAEIEMEFPDIEAVEDDDTPLEAIPVVQSPDRQEVDEPSTDSQNELQDPSLEPDERSEVPQGDGKKS
jgi:segregation and condensation protein B